MRKYFNFIFSIVTIAYLAVFMMFLKQLSSMKIFYFFKEGGGFWKNLNLRVWWLRAKPRREDSKKAFCRGKDA